MQHSELLLWFLLRITPPHFSLTRYRSVPVFHSRSGARVLSHLLKQFSFELATESAVFLMLLIKIVASKVEGTEAQPG